MVSLCFYISGRKSIFKSTDNGSCRQKSKQYQEGVLCIGGIMRRVRRGEDGDHPIRKNRCRNEENRRFYDEMCE